MIRVARLLTSVALAAGLGGCVAAAIPLAASSAIVKKRMDARAQAASAGKQVTAPAADGSGKWTVVSGAAGLPAPDGTVTSPASSTPTGNVPPGMQYLYGSGEAAGASQQAYRALGIYLGAIKYRRAGTLQQVVLSDGATLANPYFEPCGKKPPAVVLDIDETALLNVGYEADEAARALSYDDARWQRWEATGADAVVAVPGAKAALDAARAAGITVIFNSNRTAANAAATEQALTNAGLGPVEHKKTLWLKGDDGGGSAKDGRRWAIATGYCVVALVGDQLGDFSDLFNDPALSPAMRRGLTSQKGIADLWGNGWFMLPNPVYGTALKGRIDDVFPPDLRWKDPK